MNTSKLQKRTSDFLSVHFGGYTIRENHMADWLITPDGGRLQLDFYIEELRKAIEVQGIQHFRFTPHFHVTEQGFERRQYLDAFKRDACAVREIELVEVCDEADVIKLIDLKPQVAPDTFVPDKTTEIYRAYVKARKKEYESVLHARAVERRKNNPKKSLTNADIEAIKRRFGLSEMPAGTWPDEIKDVVKKMLKQQNS